MYKNIFATVSLLIGLGASIAQATPSTQIWNPSTDIQKEKTWHLGIDNYFSIKDNKDNPVSFPTDLGLTYGLSKYLEVGVDLMYPSQYPVCFNLKYRLPEKDTIPALAVGLFNLGTKKDVTDYNMMYGLVAKNIGRIGRLSLGAYTGNKKLLVDENGKKANTGLIATWDKVVDDKIWVSVDYASGKNFYGCLSTGFSYSFAPNVSVIFSYVIFNNEKITKNDTLTTQLDINF